MLEEKKSVAEKISKQEMIMMKGQSVPLLGYHVLRDFVLPAINGEYQSSILYWAGRNLANQFTLDSFEECIHLFLDMGWGLLEITQASQQVKTFKLFSPYFQARHVLDNKSTFALECGFLAEAIASIDNKDTEGDYKLISKERETFVEIQIYLQEKGTEITS